MRREHSIISEHSIQPVFFAPLLSDRKDYISGSEPAITGSMNSFDQNKGLLFNGSSGLRWSFSQLAFNPVQIDIDTSYTMLLDFNRTANSGHDVMLEIGVSWSADLYFMYEANKRAMCVNVRGTRFSGANANNELNKQYTNSGFWYDGKNHIMHRIINGVVDGQTPISVAPTLVDYLYIGQTSYGGDRMNGYLKNVRFYLDDYKPNMLM